MSTLRADIEKLEEAISILCAILPGFDDLRYDVNSIADELYRTWDGAASEHFITRLRGQIAPLRDTQAALESFKEYAEETKYNMEQLDKMISMITTVPIITVPQVSSGSSTHTGSSGATHGGGGATTQSSNSNKSSNSSQKTVENVIETITKPIQVIAKGIKALFGGK